MNKAQPRSRPTSTLSLIFQVLDDRPDWPVVRILVDGVDPFADAAPDWRGFDPKDMLGARSPLRPHEPAGQRVALYRCSCGIEGCGVIAPVVVPSPDGRYVSWVDFRDYVGVFVGPVTPEVSEYEGRSWDLPDLHFDRAQYGRELDRAGADTTWETDRRKVARLVRQQLDPMGLVISPDLTLHSVTPAWSDEGVTLMFQHIDRGQRPGVRQQMLQLSSVHADAEAAASDIADQLLSTFPDDWVRAFGWSPSLDR